MAVAISIYSPPVPGKIDAFTHFLRALKVFKGLTFLVPTFLPLPALLLFLLCLPPIFRNGTIPMSFFVSDSLPSFGNRYSGTCRR